MVFGMNCGFIIGLERKNLLQITYSNHANKFNMENYVLGDKKTAPFCF